MRSARRSPLLRFLCLCVALCSIWSFAVAPCAVAAEAARKVAPKAKAKPRSFTSLADRLANTPYEAAFRSAPVSTMEAAKPGAAGRQMPPSLSLLDEVGHLVRPVTAGQVQAWSQELTGHPDASRASALHLWLGEWQLAANLEPEGANAHFVQARHWARVAAATRPADRAQARQYYGLAAFDTARALFYEGAYQSAAQGFRSLLTHPQPGCDRRLLAEWDRHASACAGYHRQRSEAGIPEPPRLDPRCGAAGLAVCLKALGLPYDVKTVLQACRVGGEGSTLADVLRAAPALGVTARAVTADEAGLIALPKPLISAVEHDHFIAVTGANKAGVTYVCSDCGE